jgi:hypothetical protein
MNYRRVHLSHIPRNLADPEQNVLQMAEEGVLK